MKRLAGITMKEVVFEFKRKYYIQALVERQFNILKTSVELRACRNDIYNHIGRFHKDHVKLAKDYELI